MRKLVLDLNALEVESFVPEELKEHPGTVGAAEASPYTQCTCAGWTCAKTGCDCDKKEKERKEKEEKEKKEREKTKK